MKKLTQRQDQILRFIHSFTERQEYPPTVREIGHHFEIQSSSVFDHLKALKQKGYLKQEGAKPRTLRIRDDRGTEFTPLQNHGHRSMVTGLTSGEEDSVLVPIVGSVAAGLPVLAEENIEEHIPLPPRMVRDKNSFLLKIKGDSMTGSGILNGDHVIVRPQASADNGDIVVALLEDEATVKKLTIGRNKIRLTPTNPAYPPIDAKPHTIILGKVVGLIRGY